MTVKDILQIIPCGTVVHVFQTPISQFDYSSVPVHRQTGEISVLLASNQNYLKFEAVRLAQRSGIMSITCTANRDQEMETIRAFYSGQLKEEI